MENVEQQTRSKPELMVPREATEKGREITRLAPNLFQHERLGPLLPCLYGKQCDR
ncbi:hypothetical protein [Nannocystis pusilla]|uniref:hypothetical protein n=1 Tax=Nannocystis pusilla TaxID=889268 RepID=UPI003B7970E5